MTAMLYDARRSNYETLNDDNAGHHHPPAVSPTADHYVNTESSDQLHVPFG